MFKISGCCLSRIHLLPFPITLKKRQLDTSSYCFNEIALNFTGRLIARARRGIALAQPPLQATGSPYLNQQFHLIGLPFLPGDECTS